MDLQILSIVWGVQDMAASIAFWSEALHYKLKREPEPDFAILIPQAGNGMQLSLKLTTSREPRRHHMDLITDNQQKEVDRLLGLGATRMKNWEYEKDADYVVLLDPDGNSFCVVQAPV